MNWYDTLLFLHVLAAFVTVTAVVLFGAMFVATERAGPNASSSPVLGLAPLADVLWTVGGLTVIVFGIWLAIYLSAYHPWDGWIVAAIILWVIASAAGARVGRGYRNVRRRTGARAPLLLHAVLAVAVAALLIDMIYKPGA